MTRFDKLRWVFQSKRRELWEYDFLMVAHCALLESKPKGCFPEPGPKTIIQTEPAVETTQIHVLNQTAIGPGFSHVVLGGPTGFEDPVCRVTEQLNQMAVQARDFRTQLLRPQRKECF